MKKFINFQSFTGFSLVVLMALALSSFDIAQEQPKPWPVPDKYENMENPVVCDANSIKDGKALYNRYCASCHGKTGLGDGPKARMLKTFSGDFSSDEFQKQSDGALYYKTAEGRGEMPGYEGKLSETDIWHMVNYMKSL